LLLLSLWHDCITADKRIIATIKDIIFFIFKFSLIGLFAGKYNDRRLEKSGMVKNIDCAKALIRIYRAT
jgi:hypothetical protein